MVGQRIGYVRVSTVEQNTERQLDGVDVARTFTDHASGKDVQRPQLQLCMAFVREGDTLIVHSIDRLARNLDDLRGIVQRLVARGVRVQFVKESLTFSAEANAANILMLSMMGAFAEFERALMRERQREGIAIAQRAGVYRGRRGKLSATRIEDLRNRVAEGKESKIAIARDMGIHPSTLYDYLKRAQ